VSRSLNKIMLIGNLGQDPEIRTTSNGSRVANFSLATSRRWTGQDGQQQEKTEWHRIVAWTALADIAEQYLKKGDRVYVEGEIQYRSYEDKDGNTRYITEIAPRLQQILAGGVFVAHNAPFDLRFVEWEMKRGDFGGPKGRVLCTARLARKMVPQLRSRSLDSLIHYYGIACDARHRAYGDARATVHLLVRLLDLVEEQGAGTWADLDALLSRRKPRPKRSALPRSMEYPEWA
jgi:single-strand DNA-binding protein